MGLFEINFHLYTVLKNMCGNTKEERFENSIMSRLKSLIHKINVRKETEKRNSKKMFFWYIRFLEKLNNL